MVNNLPSDAEHVNSIPGWGTKTPHAEEQLSLCATTKESPCATTQSPCAATKTLQSQNLNK